MSEHEGITYMTADEMMSGTAMPPNGVVMFTIREVEAIVARHVAEAEGRALRFERERNHTEVRAEKAEAALAASPARFDRRGPAMSAEVERVLGEVLAEHAQRHGIRDLRVHCWCGWASEERRGMPTHRAHVVAEQAKALATAEVGLRERIAVAIEETLPGSLTTRGNIVRAAARIARECGP